VRLLGADHASVIGRFHLDRTAEAGGPASGIFTLIFRKSEGAWRIILDHTS
jgi:ketosteroid isomerase-like protein